MANLENPVEEAFDVQDDEIRGLRSKLLNIGLIAQEAPELNMANYDHDQVARINNALIEIHNVLNQPW